MKRIRPVLFGFLLLICSCSLFGSEVIRVLSKDIRIKGFSKERIFLSFHQGDIVTFDFKEMQDKKIALMEVSEVGGRNIYLLKKLTAFNNGSFLVPQTAVYSFLFKNSCVFPRNLNVNIYRKPSSDKYKYFNTNPKWVEKVDTVYNIRKSDKIIRYDTAWVEVPVRVKDTCIREQELRLEKSIRLEAAIPFMKKNREVVEIEIGDEVKSSLMEKSPVEWAYWIGVGQEADESWQKSVKMIGQLGGGLLSKFVNPLLGFAVGMIPSFIVPAKGKNVSYYFVADSLTAARFKQKEEIKPIEQGKGVVSYGKKANPSSGKIYLCLLNESLITPVEVSVKFATVYETCSYRINFEKQPRSTPVYARKKANIPKLTKKLVPVVE